MKTEKDIVSDLVNAIEAVHKNVSMTRMPNNNINFKDGSKTVTIKPFQKGIKKTVILR